MGNSKIKCKNCGHELETDMFFCDNCGIKIVEKSNKNHGVTDYSAGASVEDQNVGQGRKYSLNNVIIVGLLAVIFIGLCVALLSSIIGNFNSMYNHNLIKTLLEEADVDIDKIHHDEVIEVVDIELEIEKVSLTWTPQGDRKRYQLNLETIITYNGEKEFSTSEVVEVAVYNGDLSTAYSLHGIPLGSSKDKSNTFYRDFTFKESEPVFYDEDIRIFILVSNELYEIDNYMDMFTD